MFISGMTTEEEAKEIMSGGLGKAELEFVGSCITAPLFWIIRHPDKTFRARNGSAFFLDAGGGPFGVTAAHVIEGWRNDRAKRDVVACQLCDLPIDLESRLIDFHEELDIATFEISTREIELIKKTPLSGHNRVWPPLPPEEGKGIYFAGFPGVEKIWLTQNEISFGIAARHGVADSVNEWDISYLVEREHLIDVMGKGFPPENYDFRGMSGGPMLTVVEHKGLRSWRLAGVLRVGPNPSENQAEAIAGLEIFKARRADFIRPNGTLDVARWELLNLR